VADKVLTAEPGEAAGVSIPVTKAETARLESAGVFWILAITGAVLLVAGWLLPWFVEPISGGVGSSPQDAVVSAPTGVGSVFVYIMGAAMLTLLAGLVYDGVAAATGRGRPFLYNRARGLVALAGAASVLAIWVLIENREEPLFGNIDSAAITDNAVWMMLSGFLLMALGYGLGRFVVTHGGIVFTVVAFAFGGLFPEIFNANGQARDIIVWGASFAGIYVILALGLNVVVGFAGLLDLGYAAFFAIGAYTTAALSSPAHGLHLAFPLLLAIGAGVAALFGAILGAPTLRLRGDYLAIVTLGFGEIVPDAATNNLFGQTGGPNGLSAIDPANLIGPSNHIGNLGPFSEHPEYYFWFMLVLIALIIVLFRNVERSRLGRAWIAVREDEVAAEATGINTVTTKLLAFAIGASVSGFAGAFFGAMQASVTPETFSFAVSITALSTVVLGGIGSITGVVVGAGLISFVIFWMLPHLEEWFTTVGTTTGFTSLGTVDYSKYKFIIYGAILMGIMLLRPGGLLPSRARRVEIETGTESEALAAVSGTV